MSVNFPVPAELPIYRLEWTKWARAGWHGHEGQAAGTSGTRNFTKTHYFTAATAPQAEHTYPNCTRLVRGLGYCEKNVIIVLSGP